MQRVVEEDCAAQRRQNPLDVRRAQDHARQHGQRGRLVGEAGRQRHAGGQWIDASLDGGDQASIPGAATINRTIGLSSFSGGNVSSVAASSSVARTTVAATPSICSVLS